MKTVGVKVEEVKSSPLKAAPNGFEPTSPEARAALDSLVKDSYAWFRGLVKERRGMDDALLDKVAVMRLGASFPLELTFSCLAPVQSTHCGACNKCAERQHAFRQAGITDPTCYAAGRTVTI